MSPLREADLHDLIQLDQVVFGADRGHVYRVLFPHVSSGFTVRRAQGPLQGFGLGIRKSNILVIGPLIASSLHAAMQLMNKFRATWRGPIRIDVPDEQVAFIEQLTRAGFKETMSSPLMLLNSDTLPGQRGQLFGIADPAFG